MCRSSGINCSGKDCPSGLDFTPAQPTPSSQTPQPQAPWVQTPNQVGSSQRPPFTLPMQASGSLSQPTGSPVPPQNHVQVNILILLKPGSRTDLKHFKLEDCRYSPLLVHLLSPGAHAFTGLIQNILAERLLVLDAGKGCSQCPAEEAFGGGIAVRESSTQSGQRGEQCKEAAFQPRQHGGTFAKCLGISDLACIAS